MAKPKFDPNADLPKVDPERVDWDKVDDAALALLHLGRMYMSKFEAQHQLERTWKGFDFEVMNRLHDKGYIDNPVGKAKSVAFTDAGRRRSADLFKAWFERDRDDGEET
jgi:hypothetical protein